MKTSHTLNPVPCYIFDANPDSHWKLAAEKDLGISSLAATIIRLLGYEPPSNYDPSIVEVKPEESLGQSLFRQSTSEGN